MKIRKTYQEVNPELLYNEIKDFALKQGVAIGSAKIETYSLPEDSSSFVTRATLVFKTQGTAGSDCFTAHIVGSARGETKLMLDTDEKLFPNDKLSALESDLDFVLGSYELKAG